MATYYARNVTGSNGYWNADNSAWSLTGSGDAATNAHPVAGDTAIFDAGFTGTITVNIASACATLTVLAGATGTLTWNSFALTVTAGVTFVSGFHLTGSTGTLTLNGNQTLTTGGLTLPGNLQCNSSLGTLTLGDALTVAGTISFNANLIFAGAFDVTCGTLTNGSGGITVQLYSGRTYTVQTAISLTATGFGSCTIRTTTGSSVAYLNYAGLVTACKIAGVTFTDINASGSAQVLDNWFGGTLTNCTNINNMTSANLARAADAVNIRAGQTVGSVAGTGFRPNFREANL